MKKLAFILVLSLICLVSAAQQPHKTLLEKMKHGLTIEQINKSMQNRLTYTQRFDSLVEVYGNEKYVKSYTYDEKANLSTIMESSYENDIMDDAEKYVYAFDENNYCILEIEYDWTNGIWSEIEKKEYTNDANGNRLSEFYYSYGEPIWKILWTYDSDNHCLAEERWYYYSAAYHPSFRTENTYDSNGNLTLCLCQAGKNETWENSNKREYSYDIHNTLISEVSYEWYDYSQEWKEDERIAYSYDINNNLICKMVYGYIIIDKTEYTYNEANNLVLVVSTRFGSGNFWENMYKSEYEYDQNDSLVMELHCLGDYYLNEPCWHNNNKIDYIRNDAGYVTCKTSLRTHYVSDDSLYYESRYLYDYDSHNRMISAVYLDWSDNANDFVYRDKEICEFDDNGNILNCSFYDYEDGAWVLEGNFENTYDLTVNAANILGLSMIYNDIFAEMLSVEGNPVRNKWLSCKINTEAEDVLLSLYYSDYYDVDENQSSSLKAYSTEGSLTVENDAVADIQVFDMLGRLVAQQNQVTQCRFNLKPGVYVVKVGNASVKAVVK